MTTMILFFLWILLGTFPPPPPRTSPPLWSRTPCWCQIIWKIFFIVTFISPTPPWLDQCPKNRVCGGRGNFHCYEISRKTCFFHFLFCIVRHFSTSSNRHSSSKTSRHFLSNTWRYDDDMIVMMIWWCWLWWWWQVTTIHFQYNTLASS